MQITEKIETLLKHDFPKEKTGQEEYINLCNSIYCENTAHKVNAPFMIHLSYAIHWDNPEKCTVFIRIRPSNKKYVLPIPKDVPVKYKAGGIHRLYIDIHSMTCSFPSSAWIQCEICKTGFKNPLEMYNYILDTISIGIINLWTNKLVFKQLSKL